MQDVFGGLFGGTYDPSIHAKTVEGMVQEQQAMQNSAVDAHNLTAALYANVRAQGNKETNYNGTFTVANFKPQHVAGRRNLVDVILKTSRV